MLVNDVEGSHRLLPWSSPQVCRDHFSLDTSKPTTATRADPRWHGLASMPADGRDGQQASSMLSYQVKESCLIIGWYRGVLEDMRHNQRRGKISHSHGIKTIAAAGGGTVVATGGSTFAAAGGGPSVSTSVEARGGVAIAASPPPTNEAPVKETKAAAEE